MPQYFGIDFGTTNSALALADENGLTCLAMYPHAGGETSTFRSVIHFDPEHRNARGALVPFTGPAALDSYLAADGQGRLIQSLKSYLASELFRATSVFGRTYTLEELAAVLLSGLAEWTQGQELEVGVPVVGRPVRFAKGDTPQADAFAITRLRAAFARAGIPRIELEYEPVAAAYFYESRLDHDELVLIGDFGGGTSDFCLMRVGPGVRRRGRQPTDILGTEGVALAGDALDARIVDHLIAPALGRGSEYRSYLEKRVLPVPPWIYSKLRRWHHLSFLKTRENLALFEDLVKQSLEPHKLEALVSLVENDLGYELYRAVETTKVALSRADAAPFSFHHAAVDLEAVVTRAAFESWIAPELDAIRASVERLLGATGVSTDEIDRVFLTGGSSLVPAVRRIFTDRFGAERVRSGSELTSVALGLSLVCADRAAQGGA